MNKKYLIFYVLVGMIISLPLKLSAEGIKNQEWNAYTGMFDFSDDGKKSALFGVQHQN